MAHQWEQVRSQVLGLTFQVKPKFAKQKKLGLVTARKVGGQGRPEDCVEAASA